MEDGGLLFSAEFDVVEGEPSVVVWAEMVAARSASSIATVVNDFILDETTMFAQCFCPFGDMYIWHFHALRRPFLVSSS